MYNRSAISSPRVGVHFADKHKKKLDKFERFEQWLRENGAEFEMLELRAYDDTNTQNTATNESDCVEEKKETSKESESSNDISTNRTKLHAKNAKEIELTEESEMRGVHAKCTIPPNTICVSVPRKCLITVEMGQATEIGQAILKSDLDLDAPKHIFLMIYILWDRKVNGEKSFFKPYYDILPKTLKNMPIFWSPKELGYLEGSYLLAQIADRNEAITEDYKAICQISSGLKDIATLDEFKWARMCVCSRNFGLQIDGHRTSALVPHADMLNHYRPRETKWTFDDERQAFTITSLQYIQGGAQVYDSYGQKCNHRFLLNYGFAVEDNREIDGYCPNEVPIELGVSSDDPLYSEKCAFWTRGEGGNSNSSGVGGGGVNLGVAGTRQGAKLHNSMVSLAAAVAAAGAARSSQDIDPTALVHSAIEAAAASVASNARQTTSSSNSASNMEVVRNQYQNRAELQESLNSESSTPAHIIPSVKRVRVSISNNENTRILFSMLRVLACNEIELKALSVSPASTAFGDPSCTGYVSRAILGLSPTAASSLASHHHHAVFYRTCRDVRHPLNLRNEKAAMKLLLKVIGVALNLYPSTLAQDIADLSDENAYPRFSNQRHAKIQVRGEKEILHHFARWARTALDVMEVIERELAVARGELQGNGSSAADDKSKNKQHEKLQQQQLQQQRGFDYVIHAMEEEEGMDEEGALHHTIVRYCADVLGALRREELKTIRKIMTLSMCRDTSVPASGSSYE